MKLVKYWLPRETADAPPLEAFKVRLGGALNNLIYLNMSLFTAGGCTIWPLKNPSNSNYSVIPRGSILPAPTFWQYLHSLQVYGVTVRIEEMGSVPWPHPGTVLLQGCPPPAPQRERGVPGQSHKSHWRSLTCEMNWVTHPEEEVSNKKPWEVLLSRKNRQDRNTSSFEEPSSLVLNCLDELNYKGKSNSNKTSRNECRKINMHLWTILIYPLFELSRSRTDVLTQL